MIAPRSQTVRRAFRTFGVAIGAGFILGGIAGLGALVIILSLILAQFLE